MWPPETPVLSHATLPSYCQYTYTHTHPSVILEAPFQMEKHPREAPGITPSADQPLPISEGAKVFSQPYSNPSPQAQALVNDTVHTRSWTSLHSGAFLGLPFLAPDRERSAKLWCYLTVGQWATLTKYA